jgi:uncharacterized protein YjbI with pentapeptide repeats
MITSIIIGNRIAEARKRKNISQAQLAQQLSISPQAVGKWERGESLPDIITLNRLADILSVDLNYFSEGFHSALTESESVEPLKTQPRDSSTGRQNKKLNWDMSRGNWIDADFSGLNNLHEKFSASNLQRCKFIRSDLSQLHLKGNNVDNCDFTGSDISNSNLEHSYMINNLLVGCTLIDAEFAGTYIKGCNFSGADCTGTTFKSGSFVKNVMTNAVLNRTSFVGSDLSDIVFEGTLENCYFENSAFKKVTFQNSTLLNTFFKNKSLKGVKFVNCQTDRMTFEFLKNGKADLTGITLITS